jgi:hypothetical protein
MCTNIDRARSGRSNSPGTQSRCRNTHALRQPIAGIGHWPSAIGYWPSAIAGHRPSPIIAHRPSPIAHRPSPIAHRPSPIAHRPSPIGHRPSAAHRPPHRGRAAGGQLRSGHRRKTKTMSSVPTMVTEMNPRCRSLPPRRPPCSAAHGPSGGVHCRLQPGGSRMPEGVPHGWCLTKRWLGSDPISDLD